MSRDSCGRLWNNTVTGFDARIDVLIVDGATYEVEATAQGALLTLSTGDTVLISGAVDLG